MSEQELHDYNQWLVDVWNPNQLYIPFMQDAPAAYLSYKNRCNCVNGVIDCPGCKDDIEPYLQKSKLNCAGCKGTGKRTCGKCGGKNVT